MWKSSLRKQSTDSVRVNSQKTGPNQLYDVDSNKQENDQKRCMSAHHQRSKRNSTHGNELDMLRIEEILKSRDSGSQFYQQLRMKREEKEEQFNIHLNKMEEVNEKYFKHLQGDCKCGKCTCTRCKCTLKELKPDYKRLNRSLYQEQFQPKITDVPQPFPLDKDYYKNNAQIEMKTTQRTDFTKKKSVDPKKECGYLDRNSILCGQQALEHNTLYNNNFNIKKITPNVLFTHEPIEYLRVPHDKIKQKMNSENRAKYRQPQESLLPNQMNQSEFINFAHHRQMNLKPPISMDGRMSMNTTARDSFQGYQLNKKSNTPLKSAEKQQEQSPRMKSSNQDPYNQEFVKTKNEWVHIFNNSQIPNHQGQFLSSKTQNFYPKNINQTCEGWKEPDDIDKLPRTAYMYAYA